METIFENVTIEYDDGKHDCFPAIMLKKNGICTGSLISDSKNKDPDRFIEHSFIPNSRIKKIVFFNAEGDTVILEIKPNWEEKKQ